MTFVQLQNSVLGRHNLTSQTARDRVKINLNLRYREVQSTLNLDKTRRGGATFTTASGNSEVTVSGVAKLFGLYDGDVRHRPLAEATLPEILALEAQDLTVSTPIKYAIHHHLNDILTVRFYPRPNAVLALDGDCLLAGTDMDDDDDEPTFPVDFHDVLVRGASADEYFKIEKTRESDKEEQKFEKRLAELRYFLVKSRALDQRVRQDSMPTSGRVWPYSNLA